MKEFITRYCIKRKISWTVPITLSFVCPYYVESVIIIDKQTVPYIGRSDDMVIGENVIIRPVEVQDMPYILKWSHISDLQEQYGYTEDFTHYDDIKNRLDMSERFPESIYFTIADKEQKKPIGGCMLTDIDYANKNCICSLYIADESMRGKGLGVELTKHLIDFAFNELNLNRIGLYISDYNKRGLKCSKDCGFKVEGMMREGIYKYGRYHDIYYMGIIKSDYECAVKGGSKECQQENA